MSERWTLHISGDGVILAVSTGPVVMCVPGCEKTLEVVPASRLAEAEKRVEELERKDEVKEAIYVQYRDRLRSENAAMRAVVEACARLEKDWAGVYGPDEDWDNGRRDILNALASYRASAGIL